MKVDASPESANEYEQAALARFAEAWIIWRSRRSDGLPASWCATRRDRRAGICPTVVRDTAQQLAEALADQLRQAELAGEAHPDELPAQWAGTGPGNRCSDRNSIPAWPTAGRG